jgi:spore maturation protein CgeB
MRPLLCFFLKYDYGIPERGDSLEKLYFWPAIKKHSPESEVFWLEEIGFLENNKDGLQEKIIQIAGRNIHVLAFFILMQDEVRISTLKELRSIGCKVINWFSDDQWRFDNWSVHIARESDFVLTVNKFAIPKYKKQTKCTPILTQWGNFEKTEIDFSKIGSELDYKVSFVGSKSPAREWYVNYLKNNGIHVDCFGSGWANGRVSQFQMNEIFLKSCINLNLSNSTPNDIKYFTFLIKRILVYLVRLQMKCLKTYWKHAKEFILRKQKSHEQMKARNFEIPANGGLQLSHYTLELEDYFHIGKEILIYSSVDDLEKQIQFIFENSDHSQEVRLSGYKCTLSHSFDSRISKILSEVSECLA